MSRFLARFHTCFGRRHPVSLAASCGGFDPRISSKRIRATSPHCALAKRRTRPSVPSPFATVGLEGAHPVAGSNQRPPVWRVQGPAGWVGETDGFQERKNRAIACNRRLLLHGYRMAIDGGRYHALLVRCALSLGVLWPPALRGRGTHHEHCRWVHRVGAPCS